MGVFSALSVGRGLLPAFVVNTVLAAGRGGVGGGKIKAVGRRPHERTVGNVGGGLGLVVADRCRGTTADAAWDHWKLGAGIE